MKFKPGFYCATESRVVPVCYAETPEVRIYNARKFVQKLDTLKPGDRVYGEFNISDLPEWLKIPSRLKENTQRRAIAQAFKEGLRPFKVSA